MAAMDFPSNPSDGQVSGNFIWSASTGAWKAKPQLQQTVTQSPLVPANPNVGDIWMNTNLGISFTYYDDGTSKQWIEMVSSAVPAVNTIMPAGTIVQTARATAPDLWLLCDGTAVSRSAYPTLYAAIGTSYGSGDGSTTFNIPNLQGRVPVGKNSGTFNALGATGGAETHTLTEAQMPSHTHIQNSHNHIQDAHSHPFKGGSHTFLWGQTSNVWLNNAVATGGSPPGNQAMTQQNSWNYSDNATATNQPTTATNQNTGGGQPHNILQPYIVLNYMIKV